MIGFDEDDTRERLETDVRTWFPSSLDTLPVVLSWLDRQAAITERECKAKAARLTHLNEQQAKTIAELAAKVDETRRRAEARMPAELHGELYVPKSWYEQAKAEREHWRSKFGRLLDGIHEALREVGE